MSQLYFRNPKLQALTEVSFFGDLRMSLFLPFFSLDSMCPLLVPHIPDAPPNPSTVPHVLSLPPKRRGWWIQKREHGNVFSSGCESYLRTWQCMSAHLSPKCMKCFCFSLLSLSLNVLPFLSTYPSV